MTRDGFNDGYLFLSTNTTNNVTYFVRYINSSHNGTLKSEGVVWLSVDFGVSSSSFSDRFKGVHVKSDLPIALTVHDFGNAGISAYLALPCHDYQISLYEYYTVSTDSCHNTTMSQALLVGCQNNTIVTITPSVDLFLPNNTQEPDIDIVIGKGTSHTVLLHEGQTLYFGAPNVDITGTHIVSDKPLTVISGHECGNTPESYNIAFESCSCHFIQLQVPPTVTWGKRYILPLNLQEWYYYPGFVKIITADRDTTITSVCNEKVNTTHYDTPGSVHSFHYNNSFSCYVEANKPILVTAILRFYELTLVLIPSIEQYSNTIDFDVFGYFGIEDIVITTTPVGFSSSAILYNGQPITNWTTVYDSLMNIVGYVAVVREYYYHYPYNRSVVHTDRDGKVSVLMAYFWSVYPAGMNLIPINKSYYT